MQILIADELYEKRQYLTGYMFLGYSLSTLINLKLQSN